MVRPKPDPNKPITMKDLDEVIRAILAGTEALITSLRRDLMGEMKSRFTKVDNRLNKLEVGQAHLKDQIDGLKADLSDTPSRRQFEKLKARVEKYHPLT